MSCIAAFDTSCNVSLAVKRAGSLVINSTLAARGRQSDAQLVPWLVRTLQDEGVDLGDIDRWIVGVGPGSYSGIRAGIGLVRGICRGTHAQCRGLASARALACQVVDSLSRNEHIAVLHDGRREQVIVSLYKPFGRGVRIVAPAKLVSYADALSMAPKWQRVITPHGNELASLLERLRQIATVVEADHVDAAQFLAAHAAWPSETQAIEASLEPIYVRPPVFVSPQTIRLVP